MCEAQEENGDAIDLICDSPAACCFGGSRTGVVVQWRRGGHLPLGTYQRGSGPVRLLWSERRRHFGLMECAGPLVFGNRIQFRVHQQRASGGEFLDADIDAGGGTLPNSTISTLLAARGF